MASSEDRRAETVPLEDEDGSERVIAQQPASPDALKGGGEWPDPDTPPEAPAPGIDPEAREEIEAQRSGPPSTAVADEGPLEQAIED